MRDLRESCRIAVVQAAPVMFDKAACTVKAVELIRAAAAEQAELIVFPELFIPGYPYGMTFGFTVGSRTAPGRKDWGLYYDNSILVPGPETEILGRAAREARAYVSIGVSERDAVNATLYNTNLIFSPAGELLTVHRKLKPTGAERVVWGDADRHYFPVAQTPWGPMASLICWESYMPLARSASRAFVVGMLMMAAAVLGTLTLGGFTPQRALLTGCTVGWAASVVVYALTAAWYGFRESWGLEP